MKKIKFSIFVLCLLSTLSGIAQTSDANLKDIYVEVDYVYNYELTPAFSSDITEYSVDVPLASTWVCIVGYVPYGSGGKVNGQIGRDTIESNLSIGKNTFTFIVTAEDGETQKKYTLVVNRAAPSMNANLSSLTVFGEELNPAFDANITDYTINVPFSKSNINGDGLAADEKASVSVSGLYNWDYDYLFRFVSNDGLQVGDNILIFTVTAEDGETQKTYTLIVNRAAPSSNADLQYLSVSQHDLTPEFESNTTSYTINVPYSTSYVGGGVSLADSKASVYYDGIRTFQFHKNLMVGKNTIEFTVTAEDGETQKIYTVVVTREPLSEREETIHLAEAGMLNSALFPDFFGVPITKLTVTGNMDVRDIYFLDSLDCLVALDLSNANIVLMRVL